MKRVAFLLCSAWLGSLPAQAQEDPLDHPALHEVIEMIQAGVGDEVILARIQRMETVPRLTGRQIAALKEKGASDTVLLALVEWDATEPSPRSGAPFVALVKVVLEGSFPVTHYEIVLDGEVVASRGEILEGESEPGRILKYPRELQLAEPTVVYSGTLTPGEHELLVGFAVSQVIEDPNDEWSEYSRQRYATAGVRALAGPGESESWGDNATAVCDVGEGQLCTLTARFERTSRGGPPRYSLTHEVDVTSR